MSVFVVLLLGDFNNKNNLYFQNTVLQGIQTLKISGLICLFYNKWRNGWCQAL